MKKIIFVLILLSSKFLNSQDFSYSKQGNNFYHELPDPSPVIAEEWNKMQESFYVSFADDNTRYPKKSVPLIDIKDIWTIKAWKGEKVHTQILVWTKEAIPALSFKSNDLINENGDIIDCKRIKPAFVRYVMADEYGGGCTKRKSYELDSSLVADPIDIIKQIPVDPQTVQPLWLSIEVPDNISPGLYRGSVIIDTGNKNELNIYLDVVDKILPPPSEWEFDLDLWQYPAPIARIHDVELWSDEHFELMKSYFIPLANAGQKVITANIIDQPWGNDHVYFDDPSLIQWVKKSTGVWEFDYNLFDKYISFMMKCGINQRINCYSMLTWDFTYSYFDEASNQKITFKAKPGSIEYNDFWITMLNDFTEHLISKGWFSITAIAMDERPLENMKAVISILEKVNPEWKIALASDSYQSEIVEKIYDYSIASYLKFEDNVLKNRKAKAMPTTFYTACHEKHLAPYTFAPPAENAWIGWYAAAHGYTGYLFWAYNTWVKDPLRDSRFYQWPSGTCYQFYPGPRSSIRFEKLIEGIQDFEKIRILRNENKKTGNTFNISKIEEILKDFKIEALDSVPASEILVKVKNQLNDL